MFWALEHFSEIWAEIGDTLIGVSVMCGFILLLPLAIYPWGKEGHEPQRVGQKLFAEGVAMMLVLIPLGALVLSLDFCNLTHTIPDSLGGIAIIVSAIIAFAVYVIFYIRLMPSEEEEQAQLKSKPQVRESGVEVEEYKVATISIKCGVDVCMSAGESGEVMLSCRPVGDPSEP